MTTTTPPDFETATAVTPLGEGRYKTRLDPAWDGPFSAVGGMIAAVLLRAAQSELDSPQLTPRILSIHYLAATTHSDADITVALLRASERNAVLQTSLHQDGQVTATALITCSVARPQKSRFDLPESMPDVPPPDQVPELAPQSLSAAPPCLQRLRMWPCLGAPILSQAPEAMTGGWVSLRDDPPNHALDAPRLVALCDLWWPALFAAARTLIGAPTLALSIHLRSSQPVTGPILARYTTTTVTEGHFDETAQLWSADRRPLADSRQLARLTNTWSRPAAPPEQPAA